MLVAFKRRSVCVCCSRARLEMSDFSPDSLIFELKSTVRSLSFVSLKARESWRDFTFENVYMGGRKKKVLSKLKNCR